MPSKIDLGSVPVKTGTAYPKRFANVGGDVSARRWQAVGDAAGLSQFGVNVVTLPPGAASSLRHWHTHEDEFVLMLEGEAVLVTDQGEEIIRAGEMAGFPAGRENAHHFVNRSGAPAVFLAVGTRSDDDEGRYADVDMRRTPRGEGGVYVSREGVPYEDVPRKP